MIVFLVKARAEPDVVGSYLSQLWFHRGQGIGNPFGGGGLINGKDCGRKMGAGR
jgi:hypothetical protein